MSIVLLFEQKGGYQNTLKLNLDVEKYLYSVLLGLEFIQFHNSP